MKLSIGRNIRAFRKNMSITQEQLAEAVGVTIGAVSKWESGASNPDIELIVELADFFSISVDVLLGYNWHGLNKGKTIERIKQYVNNKEYNENLKELEKALQKYPNCFEIIYYSGMLYFLRGIEKKEKTAIKRALDLFNNSLNFISQNTDEKISELDIQRRIGDIYIALGETDKAIEHLKKHNYCGINECMIGFYLAQSGRTEEAVPYLSDGLSDIFSEILKVLIGLAICHQTKREYFRAIECINFLLTIIRGLKRENQVSYLDKLDAVLLSSIAVIYAEQGQQENAREYLKQAVKLGKRFDRNPSYSCSFIKFYQGEDHPICDDIGESAMEGIKQTLLHNAEVSAELLSYLQEIIGGESE